MLEKIGWLLSQWWFWVGVLGYYGLFALGLWYFAGRREYRKEGGRLMVRHGRLGKWQDVEEHLKEEHDENHSIQN